jgi:hypothetical protein
VRLLAILAGYVPWSGWDGWEVHGGCLFPPEWSRGGLTPGELQALGFLHQSLSAYRCENARLQGRLAALEGHAGAVGPSWRAPG